MKKTNKIENVISQIQGWSIIQEERSQGHTGSGAATQKPLEQQVEELAELLYLAMDALVEIQETEQ